MFFDIAFPGGTHKVVTFSYDDCQVFDRRLVEMFNKYGMKATFHLNAGMIGTKNEIDDFITWDELAELYKGHEVACHGYTHPFTSQIPKDQMVAQYWEERKLLESKVKYPVRGMSYPYGDITQQFVDIAEAVGIEYSRTVEDTGYFNLPWDYMRWNPTCHHNNAMPLVDEFLKPTWKKRLQLFYIWGHSFEFHRENTWDMMDELLQKLSNKDDVWYATNIEIKDYLDAARNLNTTADGTIVHNRSAITVTLDVNDKMIEIPGGATVSLV